jgi:hypothetical protein
VEIIFARALIWLILVKKKSLLAFLFFKRLIRHRLSSHLVEAGSDLRRRITLIFAGWLPHDLASSRSCLGLSAGVSALAYSHRALEGSPHRDRAPAKKLKILISILRCLPPLLFAFFAYIGIIHSPVRRIGLCWEATRAPGRRPKYEGRTHCAAPASMQFHTLVSYAINPGGLGAGPH